MKKPVRGISGERLCFYVLPLFLYLLLIFVLSSISRYPEEISWVFSLDKCVHILEYYLLGYLLMRVLVTSPHRAFSGAPVAFAIVFGILYALSDEWHQSFVPGRYASVFDFLFDSSGVIMAAFTYRPIRYHIRWIQRIEDRIEGGNDG